ncbi:hypothetical protein IJM86_06675 [bacterium]|nr:hypothetical protein [bacterium]
MKEFLLKSLQEQKFVMVNVNVMNHRDIINNDHYYQMTNNTDLYGGDGYIRTENEETYVNNTYGKIKVIGHIILIIGIKTGDNTDDYYIYRSSCKNKRTK